MRPIDEARRRGDPCGRPSCRAEAIHHIRTGGDKPRPYHGVAHAAGGKCNQRSRNLAALATLIALAASLASAAKLPLVEEAPANARQVTFKTEAATWMSLDVSADGATIVFEALGDLYTVPIEGGEAKAITRGMAFDSQPAFSPDGSRIAFLSDRDGSENLWIMGADGSNAKKLSKGGDRIEFASPSWSPDGSHVIVSRTSWGLRTFELWAHHVEGGKGVRVTRAKPTNDTPARQRRNALGAVYSPNARFLYYAGKRGGFGYDLTLPLWQIVRLDIAKGIEDTLTNARGSAFRPRLSHDGNLLAYATRVAAPNGGATALRLRNLETGEDRRLTLVERDDQESRFTRDLLPGYTFTPDDEHLILARSGRLTRIRTSDGTVTEIPFTVQVEQTLGPSLYAPYRTGVGPVKARLASDAALSPDGRQVAFSALTTLHVHDLASGKTQALTKPGETAYQPAWSPNGREIAYVSWQTSGAAAHRGGHVWRIRANGRGEPRRVTEHPAYYTDPRFTPAGEHIVVLRATTHERLTREFDFGAPVGSDVMLLSRRGGEGYVITPARGLIEPHFGPEPNRIYLYNSGGGSLISMRLDGSDRRKVVTVKGHGIYGAEDKVRVADIRLAPGGERALVLHAHQLYLVELLNTPLQDAEVDLTSPTLPVAKLTDVGADSFGWGADGETVHWTTGATLHRRATDSIAFGTEKKAKSGDGDEEPLLEDHDAVVTTPLDVWLPRHRPEGTLAIAGATALTMSPNSKPIENAVIIVERDRIVAVGGPDTPIPEEAHVLDASGHTILPGFVDAHSHYRPLRRIPDLVNWSFLANLAYGVTTGLDVQPSTVDILAYQDLVDAGLTLGPRAFSTGPGIFNDNEFTSRRHARAVLARYKNHYRVRNLKSYIAGSRRQRQWIAQAARDLGLMPTTEGALDMKLDLTHAIDGFTGNEHNFPLLSLHPDVVELVARSGMAYTPTLLVAFGGPSAENWFYTRESPWADEKLTRFIPRQALAARTLRRPWVHEDEHVFRPLAEQAHKIARAGGRVGIGSHGQLQGLAFHWELWALASGGFTNQEALTAATRHGAEIIGISEDLGTIEPGKLADMVVLTRNPLEDLRATKDIAWVVKNGEIFDANTLNQTWPKRKTLPTPWWQSQGTKPATQ